MQAGGEAAGGAVRRRWRRKEAGDKAGTQVHVIAAADAGRTEAEAVAAGRAEAEAAAAGGASIQQGHLQHAGPSSSSCIQPARL